MPCEPLFPDEAEAALNVFKSLIVVDVTGSPTFGECASDWIFDFVAAVFGAYDAEAGKRLIREFFLCVAKKNGKSTLTAGIMLTALIRNWRRSNELIILAPTIEAAQNSFKPAADMVRADPDLLEFLHIQDHLKTITHMKTGATLKVIAADTSTVVGKKAAFVLLDELWEFGNKSGADSMLREATGGLISRPEGFIISITTQADKEPTGVFKDKLDYARNVRDGITVDNKFLPVIYEFPEEMVKAEGYLDQANWYIPNPNLERSVSLEWLEDEMRKEMAKGVETRNVFLAKYLNVEIGFNLRSDRWAGADFWLGNPKTGASNVDKTLTMQEVIRRSEVIVIGIDGGGLDDLLGLAVLGREKETGKLLLWCHAWAHEIVKERRKEIAPKLEDLSKAKELTFVKLPGEDVYQLAELVFEVEASGKLAAENTVGVDSFGVAAITKALTGEDGIAKERIVGISQGWKLNGAIKDTERDLAGGNIIHPGQALMNFAVGNAKIVPRGNAISIDKQVSGSAKIDPLMATLHAKVLMGLSPQPKTIPTYELFLVA
jgi:phage terminase large subunit-like protein